MIFQFNMGNDAGIGTGNSWDNVHSRLYDDIHHDILQFFFVSGPSNVP